LSAAARQHYLCGRHAFAPLRKHETCAVGRLTIRVYRRFSAFATVAFQPVVNMAKPKRLDLKPGPT